VSGLTTKASSSPPQRGETGVRDRVPTAVAQAILARPDSVEGDLDLPPLLPVRFKRLHGNRQILTPDRFVDFVAMSIGLDRPKCASQIPL
jgi:hypothetical protein